jgi:hypothetical protein
MTGLSGAHMVYNSENRRKALQQYKAKSLLLCRLVEEVEKGEREQICVCLTREAMPLFMILWLPDGF